MKLLVVGAAGQLGQNLVLQGQEAGFHVLGTYNSRRPVGGAISTEPLDKTDATAVRRVISGIGPNVVVDTGALHNVDYCESHSSDAYRVNRDGTSYLAKATLDAGGRLVFVSTDFVFDGRTKRPYAETDSPNPQSEYARSKLAGEQATLDTSPDNLVVRPSVIYSWLATGQRAESSSGKGLNFGTWLVEEVARGRPVRIVQDQIASPTLARDLARAILALVHADARGLFHTAGATAINRYEFSRKLVRRLGLDDNLVHPVSTAELSQKAVRPADSSLESSKFSGATRSRMLDLEEALDQFAADFESDPGTSAFRSKNRTP